MLGCSMLPAPVQVDQREEQFENVFCIVRADCSALLLPQTALPAYCSLDRICKWYRIRENEAKFNFQLEVMPNGVCSMCLQVSICQVWSRAGLKMALLCFAT